MGPLPLFPQEAQYRGPALEPNGVVRKRRLKLGGARSLLDLARDYVFFTPAVPYLYGRFVDAFLIDHMVQVGRDVPLYYYQFPGPIFSGLRDWDNVLWAVLVEDWGPLLDFTVSLALALRDEGLVIRYGQQVLEVADPLAALATPATPAVPVSAFGINGNRALLAFDTTTPLPALRRYPPDPRLAAYAGAYFAGKNPLDAAASSPRSHHD